MNAVILDTETTGLKEPALVEYGQLAVDIVNGNVEADLDYDIRRYNPGKPIEFSAMATHGITDEDVASHAPVSEFMPPPVDFIIGHNVDFDWRVMGEPNVKRICTLALARKAWPEAEHKLLALVYMLDREQAQHLHHSAHGVEADIELCLIVLRAVCKIFAPADLEALWRMSEAARVPDIMPFGKHKGVPVRQLPGDYVRWLLGQPDIDPYLRQALTGERAVA